MLGVQLHPRQKLAEIITLVREIPASDDNFHEEMVEQYGRVRRLPHLLTVKFSSAPAGVPL
nr:TnpA transposase [Escherichia coli]